jgi:hypothetical protein
MLEQFENGHSCKISLIFTGVNLILKQNSKQPFPSLLMTFFHLEVKRPRNDGKKMVAFSFTVCVHVTVIHLKLNAL